MGSVERIYPFPGCRDGRIKADVGQCGGAARGKAGEHARPEHAGKSAGNSPAGARQRGAVRQRPQLTERLKSAWAKIARYVGAYCVEHAESGGKECGTAW